MGDLGSTLMPNFIIDKFGPEFYNQGVYDSCNYMKDKNEDI